MKKFTKKLLSIFVVFALIGIVYAEVNSVTPSTNDINRVNGWAHVDEVNKDIGEVTLNFIQPRNFQACFEYRTDGDTSQASGDNYNPAVTDGLYPFYCQQNNDSTHTIEANEYVEVRMVFGAETDERFDWTRFDVEQEPFERTAEITSPLEDEEVWGMVSFEAILADEDGDDSVQWAVREGTCQAGVGTVLGNVDGRHDTYTWDNYTFHAQADVSEWNPGSYCFVFNPGESAEDEPIRLTREFTVVDPDLDDDGVLNDDDFCSDTSSDLSSLLDDLGVNRHIWTGDYEDYLTTLVPGKKGVKNLKASMFTIEDVHGCGCIQILDLIKEYSGDEMLGHYKFGCSKSIIEDFILDMNDGVLDGKYLLDEFDVPGYDESGVDSNITTTSGAQYLLESSGTYRFANWGDNGIADAMYSLRPDGTWVLGSDLPAPYVDYLSLRVDGSPAPWIGTYTDPEHIYTLDYMGTGNPIHFNIYDGGTTGDNSGYLHVKIFAQL